MIVHGRTITCTTDNAVLVSKDTTPSILIVVAFALFLCISGLLLNALIMYVIIKKKLSKSIDEVLRIILIASTFPQAMFLGIIAVYYIFLIYPQYAEAIDNCKILMAFVGTSYSLASISILIMLTMFVELYLATVKPFFYSSSCNKRFYLIVMFSVMFLLILFICICSIFPKSLWNLFRVYIFSFPALVTVAIVYLSRKINKELLEMQRRAFTIEDTVRQIRCQKRTKKFGLTIILIYAACQSPISLLMPILRFVDFSNVMEKVTILYLSFNLISFLHIIGFPVIFCFRINSIKTEFKNLFLCPGRTNPVEPANTTEPDTSSLPNTIQVGVSNK